MARKKQRPQRTVNAGSPACPSAYRDPVTRLARFCEFAAVGLVAGSVLIPFPAQQALQLPDGPAVGLDYFTYMPVKLAVIAVHTRAIWVTLAVIGVITATTWYRTRARPQRSKVVAFAPLAIFLVVGLHVAALAYLASRGPLEIKTTSTRDLALANPPISMTPATAPESRPASATTLPAPPAMQASTRHDSGTVVAVISSTLRIEGDAGQWRNLAAFDAFFSAPVTIAWILSLLIARLHRKGIDVTGKPG